MVTRATRRGPLSRALADALQDAPLLPQDAAAVGLARRYAALLDTTDDPDVLADVGPKFLRALESLGMTPAGRGQKGGQGATTTTGPLDELRTRRADRAARARAAGDPR